MFFSKIDDFLILQSLKFGIMRKSCLKFPQGNVAFETQFFELKFDDSIIHSLEKTWDTIFEMSKKSCLKDSRGERRFETRFHDFFWQSQILTDSNKDQRVLPFDFCENAWLFDGSKSKKMDIKKIVSQVSSRESKIWDTIFGAQIWRFDDLIP